MAIDFKRLTLLRKKLTAIALKILTYILLVTLAFSMLIPFIWMVSTSFMNDLEVYEYPPKLIPDKLNWKNYQEALTLLPFDRFFLNSIIISAGVVTGQLIICSLAAFSFARLHYRGRDKIFSVYLSTMMIPAIVTIIPSFLIIDTFRGLNSYWAMIVPFLNSVWGIFLLRQFFLTLPKDLEDAARIDGASNWTIYWRIILPLSRPALATLGIFSFMASWKEFLWPLIVTSQMEMRPVEVGIALFHSIYITKWPYQMAAAVVVMLPILIVFFFTQRYFIRGIALTGMKG
ncbi:carbohydrate ABC transporter permease [candidate division KSB1 bacterium]|nr:carbohydrate ABC transporter permease [candidate division KSB1 bacterium]